MVRITHRGFGLALAPLLSTLFACALWDTSPAQLVDPDAITLKDSRSASGVYQVNGLTVQAANGRQREIAGTIWLRVDAGRYAVEFDLGTTMPGFEDPVPVQVTGVGSGMIVGGVFTGTTVEQIKGINPETGDPLDVAALEIVSTSRAHFDESGFFEVYLQNSPREGQEYSPSVTVLSGRRIEASLPDVAAPFPSPDRSPSRMWK